MKPLTDDVRKEAIKVISDYYLLDRQFIRETFTTDESLIKKVKEIRKEREKNMDKTREDWTTT